MGEVEVKALDGVSVTIGKGEMLSITGPSGSGKSTLMNIIGCLDVPTSGRIEIDGVCTSGLGERDLSLIRGRKVGFVFQQYNLLSYLTVIENVALPLVYQNVGEKERFSRAAAALEQVGLSDRLRHLPRELSGGQKQRTAIARSIVANPSIILADE
ncbi:MAG TPA: macrolide ABC transporter ATP-binding protein, partial [Spirochaetaceae bacterium]|nr:macrolide ABC transporter ATP-binding protein [Spirochaetaceae bacterium]